MPLYFDRCYSGPAWSVYVRVSVTLVHPTYPLRLLDGMRCHLAETLMWS